MIPIFSVLILVLLVATANLSNAFGVNRLPSIQSSSIRIVNNIVLAAKAKKTKKKKRPAGGGFGAGASNTKKPPKEEEEDASQKRATASHILIKDDNEKAVAMLRDIKAEVADDPTRFAQYAAQYSQCGSKTNGGNLGEFGMGQMAKEFEEVVFNEEVGKVHGPIQTQFGYHLIYISERTDPNNKMDKYFNSLL